MPMDKLPAIIPPSAASLDATKEARVPAMLRIKGGQIIGIEDHLGNVLGQPLTVKSGGDGGIVVSDGSDKRGFMTAELVGGVPTGNFS